MGIEHAGDVSIAPLITHRGMGISPDWSRSATGASWKSGGGLGALVQPDRLSRNRPRAGRFALCAVLMLVALLTGCSWGQPSCGWSAIEVPGTELHAVNAHLADPAALSDGVISGYAFDAGGQPLPGVYIYIRVVPESYGEVYQTTTDTSGAYSYSVPEGVYLVLAEYNPDDEPGGGAYLEPVGSDGSVTVPPDAEVNFELSSF